MITKQVVWKWLNIPSYIFINSSFVTDSFDEEGNRIAGKYDVTIEFNSYTQPEQNSEFDMWQEKKTFKQVDWEYIQSADFISNYENMLISSGTLEWATIVS